MCDYSLHGHPNRLAQEGEHLVVAMFPGATKGFVSRPEFDARAMKPERRAIQWSCRGLVDYLRSSWSRESEKPMTAVCIPPGARLRLQGIPAALQAEWSVSETEEATFTQLSCSEYTHRDGVRFANGTQVLLQRLQVSQLATVLSLGSDDEPEAPEAPENAAFDWRQLASRR